MQGLIGSGMGKGPGIGIVVGGPCSLFAEHACPQQHYGVQENFCLRVACLRVVNHRRDDFRRIRRLISRESPYCAVDDIRACKRMNCERNFQAVINKLLKWKPVRAKFFAKLVASAVVASIVLSFVAYASREEGLSDKLSRAAAAGDTPQALTLLDQGADPRARDSREKTALGRAALRGHKQVIELLITKGADVDGRSRYGKTALMAASSEGHAEVVKALLNRGADVNARDDYNQTALMCASLKGRKEVARLLLENGADINVKTTKGYTALSIATDQGHTDVADLILEKNPDLNICASQSGRSRYY